MGERLENPPAFPLYAPGDTNAPSYGQSGMTLRDWFAGQALVALAAQPQGNDWGFEGKAHGPLVARKAYAIADAMLAERGRGQ